MKHTIGIVSLILSLFFLGCFKDDTILEAVCTNPDALNYQKNGACTFPRDSIIGRYGVIVTKYNPICAGNDSGKSNTLVVESGPCILLNSDSSYKFLSFYWVIPIFHPSSFCVKLVDGINFSIAANDSIYWYGAPVTGTGSFYNHKFTFTGTVHLSCGDFPLILNGER